MDKKILWQLQWSTTPTLSIGILFFFLIFGFLKEYINNFWNIKQRKKRKKDDKWSIVFSYLWNNKDFPYPILDINYINIYTRMLSQSSTRQTTLLSSILNFGDSMVYFLPEYLANTDVTGWNLKGTSGKLNRIQNVCLSNNIMTIFIFSYYLWLWMKLKSILIFVSIIFINF